MASSTLPINQDLCKSPSGHSLIMFCAELLIPELSCALCYNVCVFPSARGANPGSVLCHHCWGMISLFWFLGWLCVQCYLTDRFSTECENSSSWASEQSIIELATYVLPTNTHTHTEQPASSPCRVSGYGKWNYSPSYREKSFFLSLPFSWHFFRLQTELN